MKRANFPGRRAMRKEQAEERNKKWAELSNKEKLAFLDKRLGKDKGAKEQREKLKEAKKS